MIINIKLG